MRPDISIVVPTLGRSSLPALLAALPDEPDWEVILVDDRPDQTSPLCLAGPAPQRAGSLPVQPKVISGRGAGPAAARNLGWRAARAPWVVFLDDDVQPEPDWGARLATDLDVPDDVGGVQGRLHVPLPAHRRPTDWERSTRGLTASRWITADMAYRRAALEDAGGFDERFPRAFREDSELAYRVVQAGWRLVRGQRRVLHPVRPEGPWVSVRVQRGNSDDALLRRLYGRQWPRLLGVPRGRRPLHAATTGAGCAALLCALAARCVAPSRGAAARLRTSAVVAAAGWLGLTAHFAAARIRPGPRTPAELATMAVTSAVIPPLASGHWLRGWIRWRRARPISPTKSGRSGMTGLSGESSAVDVYFS
ncbi:MAG: glycosyltransferase [Micromonosporaceae bacterium]|nr:glycosyltransferase [Micromonosporaceae bacterium]